MSNVVSQEGISGTKSDGKIFGNHPDKAYLYLYYDGINGAECSVTLIRKVLRGAEQM